MYGAIPYLMDRFGLDRDTAFRVVCEWVDGQSAPEASAPARTAPPPRPTRRRAV